MRPRDDGGAAPRGAHRCETHFHFAAGAAPAVEARGGAYAVSASGGGNAGVEILSPRADGEWERREGWVSPRYGAREPADVLTRRREISGAYDSFTFVLPLAVAARRGAELSELETESGGRAFELRRAGRRDLLLVGSGRDGEVRAAGVSSDFDWAWLSFSEAAGALEEFAVVGGSRLTLDGQEVVGHAGRIEYLSAPVEGEVAEPSGVALRSLASVED